MFIIEKSLCIASAEASYCEQEFRLHYIDGLAFTTFILVLTPAIIWASFKHNEHIRILHPTQVPADISHAQCLELTLDIHYY
jgi:hypothetical protein